MRHHLLQARSTRVSIVRRFFADRCGQDLVEYALLLAFIGVTSLAAGPAVVNIFQTGYPLWNQGIQDQWDPPDPTGS